MVKVRPVAASPRDERHLRQHATLLAQMPKSGTRGALVFDAVGPQVDPLLSPMTRAIRNDVTQASGRRDQAEGGCGQTRRAMDRARAAVDTCAVRQSLR